MITRLCLLAALAVVVMATAYVAFDHASASVLNADQAALKSDAR